MKLIETTNKQFKNSKQTIKMNVFERKQKYKNDKQIHQQIKNRKHKKLTHKIILIKENVKQTKISYKTKQ